MEAVRVGMRVDRGANVLTGNRISLSSQGDAAEERHSRTHAEPSNGASGYQENVYHAAASNKGYRAGQHGNLDAAGMHAVSLEDLEGIRYGEYRSSTS